MEKKKVEKSDLQELEKVTVVEDDTEIDTIVGWSKKLSFKGFKVLNTPWATDKHGEKDHTNLAFFIELENQEGEKRYWLISEEEIEAIPKAYKEVKKHNMSHNHQGEEFHKEEEENG